jgi:hypothetical protein
MKTFRNRTVFSFALIALAAALHAAPAAAMGHSGSPAAVANPSAQTMDRRGQAETDMQIQIDALRKEVAELKAQMAPAKVSSAAE